MDEHDLYRPPCPECGLGVNTNDSERARVVGSSWHHSDCLNRYASVSVLVTYPAFGSVWLSHAKWCGDSVEGDVWDDGEAGSPFMPDDYRGELVLMNFPLSCVKKVVLEGVAA